MRETTRTPTTGETSAQEQADIKELLRSADWDQRVEAARARREQVLARKSRAGQTKPDAPGPATSGSVTPAAPPADAKPPNTAPRPVAEEPAPPATAKGALPPFGRTPPPLTTPKSEKPVLRAIRHHAGDSVQRSRARSDATTPRAAPGISARMTLLAIACCIALGFGLSFGFGTALNLNRGAPTAAISPDTMALSTAEAEVATPAGAQDSASAAAEAPAPAAAPPATRPPPSVPIFDITTPAAPPKIHVYAPDSVTAAALDQNSAQLDQNGFEIATVHRLSLTISAPHVRYYDVTDAPVARQLAQDLQIEARDFTQSGNGAPGRIEVWLDGTTNRRSAWNRQANPVDELIRLGNRFLRSLQ